MPYIPNTDADRRALLERIGVASFEDLLSAVPDELLLRSELHVPPPLSEMEVKSTAASLASRNRGGDELVCFAGAGAYDHYIPSIIDHILRRSEFYTAYTPYQAEVSQGTLQAIYEYQSMICELTQMEVANASMYDAGSALAEAAHMAHQITGRDQIVTLGSIHPFYLEILRTYGMGQKWPLLTVPAKEGVGDPEQVAAAMGDQHAALLVQHPNFYGCLEQMRELADVCHKVGALLVVSVDPLSLGVLEPPGSYGADIVVGEGQGLGMPLSYGGPYLGIMATRRQYIRTLPGRLIGAARDAEGRRGFVMTLQTREQHIRRGRATSNICTNEGLCALAACIYMAVMGKKGIQEVAELCLQKSHYLAGRISQHDGFTLIHTAPFFSEFVVRCSRPAHEFVSAMLKHSILAGVALGQFSNDWRDWLLVAVTEKRTRSEMDRWTEAMVACTE